MRVEIKKTDDKTEFCLIAETLEDCQKLKELPVAWGYKITGSAFSASGVNEVTFTNRGPGVMIY